MPNASTLTTDKSRFFGLFIGPSGSGKTPSACSFIGETGRALVLDFDGRIRGILGTPWIDRARIDYEYYPPLMGNTIGQKLTFDKLNTLFDLLFNQCQQQQCPYDTLILDSLTTQTFAFICDALPITHAKGNKDATDSKDKKDKGRMIGSMRMAGPDDYNFESTGTNQVLAFLRSLPIKNVIVTAHIVDRYGKEDPDNVMSPSVKVGERLSIRDKLAANIPGMFDHVFRFERRELNNQTRVYVRFWSDVARTVYPNLPHGEVDITGKDFYKYFMELANK